MTWEQVNSGLELRTGDKVRVVRDGTVTHVLGDGEHFIVFVEVSTHEHLSVDPSMATLLIDRGSDE